jgi:hypothetical protein
VDPVGRAGRPTHRQPSFEADPARDQAAAAARPPSPGALASRPPPAPGDAREHNLAAAQRQPRIPPRGPRADIGALQRLGSGARDTIGQVVTPQGQVTVPGYRRDFHAVQADFAQAKQIQPLDTRHRMERVRRQRQSEAQRAQSQLAKGQRADAEAIAATRAALVSHLPALARDEVRLDLAARALLSTAQQPPHTLDSVPFWPR